MITSAEFASQPPTDDALDSAVWREHLSLFDPEDRLSGLMAGLNEVLEDRYEAFYGSQLRIARMDPRLGAYLTDKRVEEGRDGGIAQFRARFTSPLSDSFAGYSRRFGQLLVRIGGSPHTAMALVSCAYGEAMKVAIERLNGETLARASRAIRMLTSIESDIMVSAMHETMRELHTEQLARQAEQFETSVLASVRALSERSERLRESSSHASEVSRNLREASCAVASAAKQSVVAMNEAKRSVGYLGETVEKVQASVTSTDGAAQDASVRAAASAASAHQLNDNSTQIEAIVKLIRSIAEQTQILALNATIEAARAGTEGNGFAVVANEVKNLASQTSEATSRIGAQVGEMLAATRETASAAVEISDRMTLIGHGTERVREEIGGQLTIIEQIMDAIAETFVSAEHVSQNVSSINQVAEEVMQRFSEVEADFASVDDLLGRVANDVRAYRQSFDRLITRQVAESF